MSIEEVAVTLNYHRFCPLHYAAKFGHTDIINQLVRQGNADVESETREGFTALHLATMYDREEAVTALVTLLSIDALNLQVPFT